MQLHLNVRLLPSSSPSDARGVDSLTAVRQFGVLMVFHQGIVHGSSLEGLPSTTPTTTRNPYTQI
jgi:hypothetical protein